MFLKSLCLASHFGESESCRSISRLKTGPTFISNIFLSFWTKLVEMLDENVNPLKKAIRHLYPTFFSLSSIHSSIFKMAAYKGAVVMVLTKLVDSDDEKPC